MLTDIKQKIKRQRIHLVSTQHFLIEKFAIKKEIMGFIQDSEDQLGQALPADSSRLREKLAADQRLYIECKTLIGELQTEINTTKAAIEKLKLQRHYLFFPTKTSGFLRKIKRIKLPIFLVKLSTPSIGI